MSKGKIITVSQPNATWRIDLENRCCSHVELGIDVRAVGDSEAPGVWTFEISDPDSPYARDIDAAEKSRLIRQATELFIVEWKAAKKDSGKAPGEPEPGQNK